MAVSGWLCVSVVPSRVRTAPASASSTMSRAVTGLSPATAATYEIASTVHLAPGQLGAGHALEDRHLVGPRTTRTAR